MEVTSMRKGRRHTDNGYVKIEFCKVEFYVSRYDLGLEFEVKGVSNFQEKVIKYSL